MRESSASSRVAIDRAELAPVGCSVDLLRRRHCSVTRRVLAKRMPVGGGGQIVARLEIVHLVGDAPHPALRCHIPPQLVQEGLHCVHNAKLCRENLVLRALTRRLLSAVLFEYVGVAQTFLSRVTRWPVVQIVS